MAVLRLAAAMTMALSSASCYSPELRDCTVVCASQEDCASGQICGADQFCAAPEIAGRCSSLPGDAGSQDRDAGVVDGKVDARPDAARPDAPVTVPFHLKIDGEGRVLLTGQPTCEKRGPQNGDCTYQLRIGDPFTLTAQPYEDSKFDRWNGGPCNQQAETCSFIATAAGDVHARFKKED
ncbi:MAG: hypothetical protein HOV81_12490 [Kofleriaceae bacterium]|nr:hypothetical protein [Kofleriaceae bacterium]